MVGCSRPAAPPNSASASAFVFDQEQGLQSSPPSLEADVELPSGVSDFELALRCRAEGKPCWRAVVMVSLVVDRESAPALKLAWRDHPETNASVVDSCAAGACTIRLSSEWFERLEDARRLGEGKNPPIDGNGRAHFVGRIDNAGKPLRAHLSAQVFQWLE
ncbi:hypothetical protein AKJ09_09045 [Labilithrix luteola]|uniref:Uncharacterized protein n=1 Tax=Labilithrix luteola TaxID=1391654 RepID=A0A0K1Q9P3_9BACT|nr:hypothetical protein AKJ09_09045 [Labilithrix luteola]